jgi:hypothetical protein
MAMIWIRLFIAGEACDGEVDGFRAGGFVDGGGFLGGFEGAADRAGADLEDGFGVEES